MSQNKPCWHQTNRNVVDNQNSRTRDRGNLRDLTRGRDKNQEAIPATRRQERQKIPRLAFFGSFREPDKVPGLKKSGHCKRGRTSSKPPSRTRGNKHEKRVRGVLGAKRACQIARHRKCTVIQHEPRSTGVGKGLCDGNGRGDSDCDCDEACRSQRALGEAVHLPIVAG